MNAATIAEKLELTVCAAGEPEREVTGGYVGDLLSWVMGRAAEGTAWLTIMSNVNVAAAAVLADVSMIVLAEDVRPDADLLARAQREGLNLYSSPCSAYELAWRLHALLGPGA